MARQSVFAIFCLIAAPASAQTIGLFESQSDIGTLLHPGAAEFDVTANTYTLTSSGDNMWAAEDDFHFVWKKVTGDVMITAEIAFPATTGNAHKKGALMIRRTLDRDSDYVDAAFHLAGLTSIQSRDTKGGITREVQSYISSPKRMRLVKTGNTFFMYVAGEDGVFHLSGGSMLLQLDEPFYIGLAACAHDKDAIEKVIFSNVELTALPPSQGKPILYSTLEAQTSDRRAVWVEQGKIEAPHWSNDGKAIFFTENGRIAKIAAAGKEKPVLVDTGSLSHIDAHTGLSPDGLTLAVSDSAQIYTVPAGGGAPQLLTKQSPSYFAAWAPDGKTILFTGKREGREVTLTIPADGGAENIVAAEGRMENPAFSPDGKYIYFDDVRRGMQQIWRVLADGSQPERATSDNFINSNPQLSPDGRQLALLSQDGADRFVRTMNLATNAIRVMAIFHNVQGTLGAAPWSPDSKSLTYVSFQNAPF